MNELFQVAFDPLNLPYTLLLLLVVLYWVSVILGALDFGSFDLELDIDVDVDVDMDADVDGVGNAGGWFAHVLYFFNFGKLPFMVVMSLIILFSWMISVLANYYYGDGSVLFAGALFFPNLFVSLCLTKIISSPLIPIFKKIDVEEVEVDYIGMPCKVTLPATTSKMGQAEVIIDDVPLLINIKLSEETLDLEKGREALIVAKEADRDCFFIQADKS